MAYGGIHTPRFYLQLVTDMKTYNTKDGINTFHVLYSVGCKDVYREISRMLFGVPFAMFRCSVWRKLMLFADWCDQAMLVAFQVAYRSLTQ